VLLQFQTEAGPVRVLADAGATDYPPDHVKKKLPAVAADFGVPDLRIDLMVGTHYDADHLEGLVPIIEDQTIAIGEAWLPPVANDTESHALEDRPLDHRLFALQLAGDDGRDVLMRYLDVKATLCRDCATAEWSADEWRGISHRIARSHAVKSTEDRLDSDPNRAVDFFKVHLADAEATLGFSKASTHADEEILPPELPGNITDESPAYFGSLAALASSWAERTGRADVEAQTLAFIRRSAAKDAINANSLAKVVAALKARNIPIRCTTIEDGKPRRFTWAQSAARFIPSQNLSGELELLLLAPSEGLVKKHWDRLPTGAYLAQVVFARLPVKSITPSNQLSYVMRFNFSNQNLLIAGDSGCVDFSIGRSRSYHPSLISNLAPLHVIQVAHHGGANGHFYNALLASKYPEQKDRSYLLLSHAVDDKHRPSELFGKFVELVRKDGGDDVSVLFTSRPQEKFVRDFRDIVEAVAGGPAADCGDVQLRYDHNGWRVTKHAVKV
jgi:hypothetical protein